MSVVGVYGSTFLARSTTVFFAEKRTPRGDLRETQRGEENAPCGAL